MKKREATLEKKETSKKKEDKQLPTQAECSGLC